VNEQTIGDAYPLPGISEILDHLGQSKYFTCLDMVMGYHQIELEQEGGTMADLVRNKVTGSIRDFPPG
jgi:hypothetical protein